MNRMEENTTIGSEETIQRLKIPKLISELSEESKKTFIVEVKKNIKDNELNIKQGKDRIEMNKCTYIIKSFLSYDWEADNILMKIEEIEDYIKMLQSENELFQKLLKMG